MLSSSTIVAPAAIASCTCAGRSHSTSTVRPGHNARARATAAVIPRPARWLSFTSTNSDSEPRWFTPPPARTAAFSTARSPGSVLRVSQIARRRSRGLDEPAGERRHPRQVAQEVERGALAGEHASAAGPDTSPSLAPRPTASPSSTSQPHRAPEGRAARTPRSRTRCRRSRLPTRATTSTVARDVGGDQRGREVAERPDVLGQRGGRPAPAPRAPARRSRSSVPVLATVLIATARARWRAARTRATVRR